MPITRTEDLKEGGFAQVREVLQKFKGLVTGVTFDEWGGQLIDEKTGKKRPPREFLEINFIGAEVLAATEELAMDISEQWSVRINCSNVKNSFWGAMFLPSADKFKVVIPDGLPNKMLTMEKQTYEADDPVYNKTDWVIAGVENPAGISTGTPTTKTTKSTAPQAGGASNPMDTVEALAIDKTEDELKAAIPDALKGDPMLPLAQVGLMTQALINEKRIALVDGKYQKPA